MIQCLTPLISSSSCSSIRCTSSSARQLVRRFLGAHQRDGVLQAVDLVDHGVAAHPHPLDLGLDLLRLDEVVRDVDPAGRHQHGTPDGDAAGDCQAVDRKGHGRPSSFAFSELVGDQRQQGVHGFLLAFAHRFR